MSFALTIRAAVLITWSSASPKVSSEPWWVGLGSLHNWTLTTSHSAAVTRGDVFTMPEDDYWSYDYVEETKNNTNTGVQSETTSLPVDLKPRTEGTLKPTAFLEPEEQPSTSAPNVEQQGETLRTEATDQGTSEFPEDELCSGKPFDAFTDLKNGSLFAFRGDSADRCGGGSLCLGIICFSHSLPCSRAVLL